MASKMFSPASSVLSSPEEEEDEEVLAVPENVRKQTQVLFYEYVDKRSHVDHGLSDQQASLLHESASSCIRRADIGGQGEAAERVAQLLCEYGDRFQKEFDEDEILQGLMIGLNDTDTGRPSTGNILSHVRIIINRIFGTDPNGAILTQNITFGRVAALFYYIYSMCKRFLKDTFANHTLIQMLMSLGGYLVLSLVKVKFFQWLSDQGGWGQAIVNISSSVKIPTWSSHMLLVGGVFLIGLWAYRVYKGL